MIKLTSTVKKYGALIVCLFACSVFFSACDNSKEEIPDISQVPEIDVEVVKMEEEIVAPKSKAAIEQFLKEHPAVAEKYFKRKLFPSDSLLVSNIYRFVSDVHTDTLLTDTRKVFSDFDEIEKEFEQAFRFVKYYFPDFKPPKIYTNISGFGAFGFGQDIFLTEDFIVIGLDYFSGPSATYFPPDTPGYILSRYKPEYIVASTLMFLSSKYNNYDYQDKTLLADMIFYGKAYEFTDRMLPYTPDTIIAGYTSEELGLCNTFQDIIWARFVEDNLFYETGEQIKSKYVGERPTVPEIADRCPGRVGRWLGWQIVERFMQEQEETSLKQMMQMSDAKKIFQQSRYKPVRGGT